MIHNITISIIILLIFIFILIICKKPKCTDNVMQIIKSPSSVTCPTCTTQVPTPCVACPACLVQGTPSTMPSTTTLPNTDNNFKIDKDHVNLWTSTYRQPLTCPKNDLSLGPCFYTNLDYAKTDCLANPKCNGYWIIEGGYKGKPLIELSSDSNTMKTADASVVTSFYKKV